MEHRLVVVAATVHTLRAMQFRCNMQLVLQHELETMMGDSCFSTSLQSRHVLGSNEIHAAAQNL